MRNESLQEKVLCAFAPLREIMIILCVFAPLREAFSQDEAIVRTYGGPYYEEGRQIIECSDYGYIVIGTTGSDQLNNTDFYLLRLDDDLNCVWSKNLGGAEVEWGYSIVEDAFGTFYICGYTNSFGNGAYDALVYRVDANGEIIWQHTYGGTDWDFAYKIVAHPTTGFLLCGKTYSQGAGSSDGWLFHIDAFGNMIDEWTYGGEGEDEFVDVEVTEEGKVVCGGSSIIASTQRAWIILLSSMDEIVWEWMSSSENSDCADLTVDEANIYFCGYVEEEVKQGVWGILDNAGIQIFINLANFDNDNCYLNIMRDADRTFICGTTEAFGAGAVDGLTQVWNSNNVYHYGPTIGGAFSDFLFSQLRVEGDYVIYIGVSPIDNPFGELAQCYLAKYPNAIPIIAEYEFFEDECFSVDVEQETDMYREQETEVDFYMLDGRIANIDQRKSVLQLLLEVRRNSNGQIVSVKRIFR